MLRYRGKQKGISGGVHQGWFLGKQKMDPQQASILLLLAINRWVSKEEIIEFLYPDPDDEPDDPSRLIQVKMCQLNKKLRREGYKIISDMNGGYYFMELAHAIEMERSRYLQNKGDRERMYASKSKRESRLAQHGSNHSESVESCRIPNS